VLQEAVDHIYSVFVNDVARNRGKTEEETLKMADGKVFLGKQAIDVGLADGVNTLSGLIDLHGRLISSKTIRALVKDRLVN
jgi:ClpP class serine protease